MGIRKAPHEPSMKRKNKESVKMIATVRVVRTVSPEGLERGPRGTRTPDIHGVNVAL